MRILVVGAIQGATVPIGRAMARAFSSLGQTVQLEDFSDLNEEFESLRKRADSTRIRAFMAGLRKRLLTSVVGFSPQMVLGIAQCPLNDLETLAAMRRAGIILCYWFTEDYRLFPYWRNIAAAFDYFFTIQQEPFFEQLRSVGCLAPYYLPTAFDDLRPVQPLGNLEQIPVSFVGAPYPNRIHFLSSAGLPGLRIFGEGWGAVRSPAVSIGDSRVSDTETEAVYRRSLVNLNLHSSAEPEGFGAGDFVNNRTFEIAGLGGFQVTDRRQLLPLHFEYGNEVVACERWSEMEAAVEYYLRHEEERKVLAEKGRRRVLKEHTYRHRATRILSWVCR